MKSRSNLVITILLLCHLFLLPAVVMSRLPPSFQTKPPVQVDVPPGCTVNTFTKPAPGHTREPIAIKAQQCEKERDVYKLHGGGEIQFRNYVIRGDEITYDENSGEATATGHVTLDGGPFDQHIESSHGSYNVQSETGRFYDVFGTTGMRFKGKNVVLTTSNPTAFTGKWVEKVSPTRLIVHHGTVTSCSLPTPKWTFNAERAVVDIGGDAKIYNSTFRIRGIPTFYLPFGRHPVEHVGRHSGFLIPTIGQSSIKGTILGDSFFWAINRSMDATVGAQLYSARGFAQNGNFRMRPNPGSYLDVTYFGVLDRGLAPGNVDQGGEDIRLNGESRFGHGYRAIASIEYLSRYVFRAAFAENFALAVTSEVNSAGFISRTVDGFSFNAEAAKYQNFQSTNRGDVITLLHIPGVEFSSVDRKLANTPLYWRLDSAAEGVSHTDPTFSSANLVGRFDVHPSLSLPLFLRGWTFTPEVGGRNTFYTQSRIASGAGPGVPANDPINRRNIDVGFELRPPTLVKVFEKPVLGRKVKHTLEPAITYSYINGIENFNRLIRFDYRDIVSDENSAQISLMNRFYARPIKDKSCSNPDPAKAPDRDQSKVCSNRAREFISWEIAGKYFFDPNFGGAIVPGTRNVLASTEDLTGIAFLTEPRRFSPIVSRLRLQWLARLGIQWNLDYDAKKGKITGSSAFFDYRIRQLFFNAGHSLLQAPGEVFSSVPTSATTQFNQFHLLLGYGNPGRRGASAAVSVGFDANAKYHDPVSNAPVAHPFIQYSAFQSGYNWDCCGLTFEYRRFALGPVRNENLYRFAFNVANIGTFGNLKRTERIF